MSEHACAIVINDHHTDIVLKSYSDRTLLIITQFKKFGTLMTIKHEYPLNEHYSSTYSIKYTRVKFPNIASDDMLQYFGNVQCATLTTVIISRTHFGSDSDDVHLAGRYIAQQINIEKPLLLSIALKDYNAETLKFIAAAVNQIKPW